MTEVPDLFREHRSSVPRAAELGARGASQGPACLRQVSGRSDIRQFSKWSAVDVKHIGEWSIRLDLVVIARPVVVGASGSGGY